MQKFHNLLTESPESFILSVLNTAAVISFKLGKETGEEYVI